MSQRPRPRLGSFRNRLSGRKKNDEAEENGLAEAENVEESPAAASRRRSQSQRPTNRSKKPDREMKRGRSLAADDAKKETPVADDESDPEEIDGSGRRASRRDSLTNVFGRFRSRSRSRSRSQIDMDEDTKKEMLVAVTSCRSDGYYNQKAPGSTFKLPRKAPTNLKLFHELAVGVKDAYIAIGAVPRKPTEEDEANLAKQEFEAQGVLYSFLQNLDFVS